jgi:ribonuclease Z
MWNVALSYFWINEVSMTTKIMALASLLAIVTMTGGANASPCLVVTLTGTQSGPAVFNGQAGAGTLISYGDDNDNCRSLKMQFDAGRGTNMRLSQVDVTPGQLDAMFFTHIHGDHTEGFADVLQHRWFWNSKGPKLDVICSSDVQSPFGFTVSCRKFVTHIGDAFLQSGEIAQRRVEGGGSVRLPGGPAELANVINFDANNEPRTVWSKGDVKVSAIRSTHIPGHVSYRVDTPAGSVVIGGDATNDVLSQPRPHSTSDQVELLAQGVDVIVHSTMHPVMGPDRDSGMPAEVFNRQSSTSDLGAMAQRVRAKHLMLTHLGPSIGAARQGAYKVPGGPLTESDFRKAAAEGGFTGNIIVGTDLSSLRLPAK